MMEARSGVVLLDILQKFEVEGINRWFSELRWGSNEAVEAERDSEIVWPLRTAQGVLAERLVLKFYGVGDASRLRRQSFL